MRVGAAIFNADHARLGEELARVEAAGIDFIHFDVFDGHLVTGLGFPPQTIAALRLRSSLSFEAHLGAVDPLRFVPPLAEGGVDLVLLHPEGAPMLYETLAAIKAMPLKVGLALGLGTPLSVLEPVAPLLDTVLLLSRPAGEAVQGASFDPLVLDRVQLCREMLGDETELQVAGSVRAEHSTALVAAGVDAIALGAALFRAGDLEEELRRFRTAATRGVA
jgi:ribulose-phosphate 3-epimerase